MATLTAPRPDNAFIMAAAASGVGRYVLAAQRMIEELRLRGGGTGLFTGCAAGDTGAAILIRVHD